MVDSAVILDNINNCLPNLYNHLKSKKIDICLNNVIFKWLVTLFFENMDETIYLPIMDSLLLFGDITLYKASILILYFEEKKILKCNNLCDASIFFDEKIKLFSNKKFSNYLLNKDLFNLNIEDINKYRARKLPKINENIKQISEFENKKKKKLLDSKCNIDWPYCTKLLGTTRIIDVMKYKLIEKPLIENDYYDVSHNVYKLAESGEEEQINLRKYIENEKDEIKKRTKIYGNLLIDRPHHKCDKSLSSRKNILGENAGKKSSLMGSFFEACKKSNEESSDNMSNSEVLMSLLSDKNEIDHNKFIEKIMDNPKEKEEEEEISIQQLRKGSWFKKMPNQKDDDFKEK